MPHWALLAGWWSSPFGLKQGVNVLYVINMAIGFSASSKRNADKSGQAEGKECVSLPQVREPSVVTHLCFTVSVSLAVFVLVSLASKCCCSWDCFK